MGKSRSNNENENKMKRLLYHGATDVVQKPDVTIGRQDLDFGRGFYLTDIREQAEKWAVIVSGRKPLSEPVLNVYEFEDDLLSDKYNCLYFAHYDEDWLRFVVQSRLGLKPWLGYDIVEGGVANDRVIDTVENYMAGTMPADIALQQLSLHQPNNQVCILNQEIVNERLIFIGKEVLNVI